MRAPLLIFFCKNISFGLFARESTEPGVKSRIRILLRVVLDEGLISGICGFAHKWARVGPPLIQTLNIYDYCYSAIFGIAYCIMQSPMNKGVSGISGLGVQRIGLALPED